jgi:proteasome accessory factor B
MVTKTKTGKKTDARARLLRLAAWLGKKGSATRDEIYAEFSADYSGDESAREMMWTRDKRDLRGLGIPIVFAEEEGEKGVYIVDPTSCTLPKLEFAPEEAAVLWTAGQAALRTHDHPLHDDLEVALRKLVLGAKGLPPKAATLEADSTVLDPEQVREWLDALADAVERRKRVRLTYRKPAGEVTDRFVDVYGYAWRRGHWIFVGHCHLRNGVRIFLLERVQELELAPVEKKGKPDYRIPDDFDIRAWSRQEPWDYLVHEPREASIRFRGSLALIAPQLLPNAQLTREPDNARVARLVVRNLGGLVRQALAWGPEAEVLEPTEARQMARAMLAALAAKLTNEATP